jgi:ElaB/YqjD/DUF883 family membrane-anchored ribosome-binding protein
MDQEPNVIAQDPLAQDPAEIHQKIDETRSALTDKLETLENQVRDTVETAKASVVETIDTVKSSVQETVATVKRTFDLSYQVDRHPWGMVGGSVLVGFLAGTMWNRRSQAHHVPGPRRMPVSTFTDGPGLGTSTASSAVSQPEKPGIVGRLFQRFGPEIEQAKQVAIGAAMALVRDLIKQSVPQFAPHVDRIMDSATDKMGGQPIQASMTGSTSTSTEPGSRSHDARCHS